MKKVLFLVASLLIGMITMAQSVKQEKSNLNAYLDVADQDVYWYRASAADVVTQADTLKSWVLGVDNKVDALKQYMQVKLTENSGTAGVVVKLQGKYFWGDSWTDISSATYAGAGSDTTIIFDVSSANHYRFYRELIDGISDSTFNVTVTKSELQFYK